MRSVALAVLAMLVLVPSAAISQPRGESSCCYVLSTSASGRFSIDYGDDLSHNRVGTYRVLWLYGTKTIASYTRQGGLTLQGPGLLRGGFSQIADVKNVLSDTKPPYAPIAVPQKCEKFSSKSLDWDTYAKVSPKARDKFAQIGGDLEVTPGTVADKWRSRCTQVDGANSHGLHADVTQSPEVKISRLKSRLAGKGDFSIDCYQGVSVEDPNPTPHTFSGDVEVSVRFHRFPATSLDTTEKTLNLLVGEGESWRFGDLPDQARAAKKKGGEGGGCSMSAGS